MEFSNESLAVGELERKNAISVEKLEIRKRYACQRLQGPRCAVTPARQSLGEVEAEKRGAKANQQMDLVELQRKSVLVPMGESDHLLSNDHP